jgi:Polysaccharide deacetylase
MRHSVRRAWCSAGDPIPDKPVLLTFDNAYADIYTDIVEHALLVLYKCGLHGVVFVITGQPGGSTVWEGLRLMTMEQIQH